MEKMAVPPRFLSVYMTCPGWQQSSNFGMYLQQGKPHQGGKTNARRHTYEQNIKGENLSVRERVTDSEADITGK